MKRAEAQALRSIAQLHRELAEAYERLAAASYPETPKPVNPPKLPCLQPSEACIESTRRALRKKGIAA